MVARTGTSPEPARASEVVAPARMEIWVAPAAVGAPADGVLAVLAGRSPDGATWTAGIDAAGRWALRVHETGRSRVHRLGGPARLLAWTLVRVDLDAAGRPTLVVGDRSVGDDVSSPRWSVLVARQHAGTAPGPRVQDNPWYDGVVGLTGPLVVDADAPRPDADPAQWPPAPRPDVDRPSWHFLPPHGWMNEPHGVLHHGGRHHLFYQRNELGPFWGSITWGHAVSDDLVHWADLGSALAPHTVPTAPQGVWSGSSEHDGDGVPLLFFTAGDARELPNQRTVMASPGDPEDPDLRTWIADGPPLTTMPDAETLAGTGLTLLPGEFRDPFVWREGRSWFQLVGAGVVDRGGTALLFTAPEAVGPWDLVGPLLVGDATARPDTGVMWELPSLVPLGAGTDGAPRHLFLVTPWWPAPTVHSLQHQWYWVGRWDASSRGFRPDHDEPRSLDIGGYLTGVTPSRTPDGRTLLWSITQDLLPDDEHLRRGWAGSAGVPLEVGARDGSLTVAPAREVAELRGAPRALTDHTFDIGAAWDLELVVELGRGDVVRLAVRQDEHDEAAASLELTRIDDDEVELVVLGPLVRGPRRGRAAVGAGPVELRVLADHSVVEAFVGDRLAATTRAWAAAGTSERAAVRTTGRIVRALVWPLTPTPVTPGAST
ncbi:glycoside hydrolase family 32 protein [Cellulomonas composti]|uniref:glycoside hydrolase family 32 protein n=1 Tax=Cellulomonas composti TaxID=266130 RepID=UPI0011BF4AD3|nr:glycoside hydrolase family 32 protein [Cellulomonas composti]